MTSHSASLSGLAANTLYHYRVKSRDAAGNLATSGDFTFTTPASGPIELTGTIIGTPGSWNNSGNTIAKAFDDNFSTFFDAPDPGNGAWLGLDLGTTAQITQVKYAPRASWASRMVGGIFQGSNTANFSSGVVNLFTITSAPVAGSFTTQAISNSGTFRYVRYLSPNGGYGNIAELEFYGTLTNPTAPTAPTGVTATAGNGQVALTWNASSGATNYNIYRATTSGGEGSTPYRTGITTTSFTDTALTNGTTYYYQVTAVNSVGESPKSSEVSATPAATIRRRRRSAAWVRRGSLPPAQRLPGPPMKHRIRRSSTA